MIKFVIATLFGLGLLTSSAALAGEQTVTNAGYPSELKSDPL